jgi:hypothetical protein
VVVEGYRELLLPRPVPLEWLRPPLASFAPRVDVLEVPWAPGEPPYHTFIGRDGTDHSARLLLEYALDTSGEDDARAVVLPSRSCVAPEEPDSSARRFRDLAVRTFGADRVRSVCVALSEAAVETLRALAGSATAEPLPDRSDEELFVGDVGGEAGALLDANYTEALLTLAERTHRRGSLLRANPGRARLLADQLHANRLSVDPGTPASRVLESLEPGGELHDLLFRRVVASPSERQ